MYAPAASAEEIARAVRLLQLRGRREATGLLRGGHTSAARGAGLEFVESRPYVAGDDVTTIDWNATARTGELHVKRHHEERSHTLLFALDRSEPMRFQTSTASKAELAARVVALLCAVAARGGDRTGLVTFGDGAPTRLAPARGGAHTLRLLRAAATPPQPAHGTRPPSGLDDAVDALLLASRRRATAIVLSDFRDPASSEPRALTRSLTRLARRHDLIVLPLRDPAEIRLPRAGVLRLGNADGRSAGWLDTSRGRVRRRYADACEARRHALDTAIRASGAACAWLRSDQSPLPPLARLLAATPPQRAGSR